MQSFRTFAFLAITSLALPAFSQQTTVPSAPPPGTVPITSQTPVTPGQDPTAPTVSAPVTPSAASTQKAGKKKHHHKASSTPAAPPS